MALFWFLGEHAPVLCGATRRRAVTRQKRRWRLSATGNGGDDAELGAFVPERFDDSWQDGQIEQSLKNERVRYRLFRSKVLEHYGAQCCAYGLKPISPSILDVHHLDPISEGERRTKIEDLIPLCANCHRTAHLENPPIPLERLKDMVGESE